MLYQNAQMVRFGYTAAADYSVSDAGIGRSSERDTLFSLQIKRVFYAALILIMPVVLMPFLQGINAQEEHVMLESRSAVMEMTKSNAVLKLEVSKLEAPVRIQKIAELNLGMRLPAHALYGHEDGVEVRQG